MAEVCSGSAVTCPVNAFKPNGTACNDAMFCDGTDTCLSGKCSKHTGNPCLIAADCDENADVCTPPTYPDNHNAAWNCYTCHATDFNGAVGEPHKGQYTAPSQCITCHQMGTWVNPFESTLPAHNLTQNCWTCHPSHHGQSWTDRNECLVCHPH